MMSEQLSCVSEPLAGDPGDLDRLIGDPSMVRTTRVRVREQPGGLGSQGSAIIDGVSIHSCVGVSTDPGQPTTVNLEEKDFPRSINVEAPTDVQETATRGQPSECKLALMPSGMEVLSCVCGKAISQGHSMCIALDCTTSHLGNRISTLERGQLRVLKDPSSTAFVELRSLEARSWNKSSSRPGWMTSCPLVCGPSISVWRKPP
jgi:hypothetical protein